MQQLEQLQYANLMWLPNCQLFAAAKSTAAVLLPRFFFRGFAAVIIVAMVILSQFCYCNYATAIFLS
jgi:hypothetical protein